MSNMKVPAEDEMVKVKKSDIQYLINRNAQLKKKIEEYVENEKQYNKKYEELEKKYNEDMKNKKDGVWCSVCDTHLSFGAWWAHIKTKKHKRNADLEKVDDQPNEKNQDCESCQKDAYVCPIHCRKCEKSLAKYNLFCGLHN